MKKENGRYNTYRLLKEEIIISVGFERENPQLRKG